jgi:hypothetical protein
VRKRLGLSTLLAAGVFGLAACGGGDPASVDAGADPATLVPADAPVYAEATLRPEGDQRAAVESALSKLLNTQDVGAMITGALDSELGKDDLSWADDVAPWLGQRSGFFFTTLSSSPDGAAILATTDPGAAQAALEREAQATIKDSGVGPTIQEQSYQGVDYKVYNDTAYGIVGDFAVVGTEDGFKAAVDASTGSSLAESAKYTSSLSNVPDDRLATVWADPQAIVQALVDSGSIPDAAGVTKSLGEIPQEPVIASVGATSDHLAFNFSAPAIAAAVDGSPLITGFPDDAWLAFGAHGVGQGLEQGLSQLQRFSASVPAGPFGQGTPLNLFKTQTGLDLANISKWLDDVSGYVSGTGILSVGGALVLSSRDDAAVQTTLDEIHSVVTHDVDLSVSPLQGENGFAVSPAGIPIEIDVALREGKLIGGLGSGSIDRALSPSSTLADSDSFNTAAGALGDGLVPSFYLDFDPILGFLSIPGMPQTPDIEQVRPYLEHLDYLIAGAGTADGRTNASLVLGVQDASDTSTTDSSTSASSVLP